MATKPVPGEVKWMDLTVPDAGRVRDFYEGVAGWASQGVDMGGYEDFVMLAGRAAVGGVCHARGSNVGLPAVWLIYINVADLDEALSRVAALGGEVARDPKTVTGYGRFAVVKDPAGAFVGLFEPAGISTPKPAKKQVRRKPSGTAKKKSGKSAGKKAVRGSGRRR